MQYIFFFVSGHYVAETQKAETLRMSVEEMVHLMKTELTQGCIDMPEIKCGVIGEIASSWPIHGIFLSIVIS